jgi:hypothetical protein
MGVRKPPLSWAILHGIDLTQDYDLHWNTNPMAYVNIGLYKKLDFIKLYCLLKHRTVLQIWL